MKKIVCVPLRTTRMSAFPQKTMAASIERALSVSRGNPYVAAELIQESVPGDPYWDLRWVRGTNTSVFLSCYFDDGEWKLLAKGAQMRRGFVPMMETIDGGITTADGVNNYEISAYPPSKIRESGRYAMEERNVTPFNVVKTAENLAELMDDYTPHPVKASFFIMRIRQWGKSDHLLREMDIKNSEWYQRVKAVFSAEKSFYRFAVNLLADNFERYARAAREARDRMDRKGYAAVRQLAADEHGLKMGNFFVDASFKGAELTHRGRQLKLVFEVPFYAHDKNEFFDAFFAFMVFGSDETIDAVHKETRGILEVSAGLIARVDFAEKFFEGAIDLDKPPIFTLTSLDRGILEAPVQIVVASTSQRALPPHPRNGETNIFDSIAFGPGGVDVIYVRASQRAALERVLDTIRPPIRGVEIRVDDSVFS